MDVNTAGMAAYERVAELIRADIRRGVLQPGDKLPGNRALAERYDVALGTAQKALRVLQDGGWLTATPAVGVFVKGTPDEPVTVEALARQVEELRAALAELSDRVDEIENVKD
ncbi:GntR family transcriptional regulator [Prauserella endophytica]|uniref:GntR family transcriptional regulator n=1 Tax=Prauserella endophytica TaxID=1592324 RepID=A0ABY2S0N2_9PSEU|nr:GntR family transcriptional regulator [Prauserella endophytica]TKG67530.1 GntR family transcriptional regulator [Prauserella endophytica]